MTYADAIAEFLDGTKDEFLEGGKGLPWNDGSKLDAPFNVPVPDFSADWRDETGDPVTEPNEFDNDAPVELDNVGEDWLRDALPPLPPGLFDWQDEDGEKLTSRNERGNFEVVELDNAGVDGLQIVTE